MIIFLKQHIVLALTLKQNINFKLEGTLKMNVKAYPSFIKIIMYHSHACKTMSLFLNSPRSFQLPNLQILESFE